MESRHNCFPGRCVVIKCFDMSVAGLIPRGSLRAEREREREIEGFNTVSRAYDSFHR